MAKGNSAICPEGIRWRAGEAVGAATGQTDVGSVLRANSSRHTVVQLNEIPTAEKRAALEAAGVKLLRYLGTNAYFAKVTGSEAAAVVAEACGVTAAFDIHKDQKLHPMLLRGEFPGYARFRAPAVGAKLADERGREKESDQTVGPRPDTPSKEPDGELKVLALYVVFHPDVDLGTEAVAAVERHGGLIRSKMRSINAAVVWIPRASLDALAAEDVVEWIEPPLPRMKGCLDWARWMTGAAHAYDPNYGDNYNLSGAGLSCLGTGSFAVGPVRSRFKQSIRGGVRSTVRAQFFRC